MKLTILIVTMSILSGLSAETYSQTTKLTIAENNSTLLNVLRAIEEQSEFKFFYNEKVDVTMPVSVEVTQKSITEILDKVLSSTSVKYKVIGRQIALYDKDEMEPFISEQQGRKVTGKVADSSGATLPGVSVVIKGTTSGVITDMDGKYALSNVPENAILQFSFVGMKTQEVKVGTQTLINMVLSEETIGIEEVVAVGYGTMKKSDLTGSVVSIKSDDLVRVPVTGIDHGLQGRAAGVFVSKDMAQPGSPITIRIRGINSIQGNNNPLYVIDGIVGADINSVSPPDIKSIEILKDASSTAIYGARGANGVILVTTKSGIAGKNIISFDSYYGLQKVNKTLDLLKADEFAQISNLLRQAAGQSPLFDLNNLPGTNTNWQDEVLRTAPVQNYSLSASGGKEDLKFFISGNYIDQQGIIEKTDFSRFNLRINVDANISDRVKVGTRIGISRGTRDVLLSENSVDANISPLFWAQIMPPTSSPYDADGKLVPAFTIESQLIANPIHQQRNIINLANSTGISGSTFAEIELFKGLVYKPSINYNLGSLKNNQFVPSTVLLFSGYRSSASVNTNNSIGWETNHLLNYTTTLGNWHNINLMGGFIASKNRIETTGISVSDFALDLFEYNNLSSGKTINSVVSDLSERAEAAFIGRVNYNYKGKYLFTFNSRYDGSSIFGTDKKWGFFPSVSAAWRISEESFIKNLNLFENLKIRGGYGISGSEALGPYASMAKLAGTNAYIINGAQVIGYMPVALAVNDLHWEETGQLDIGLDASLFHGRLGFVFDYYKKKTDKLFLNVPLPQTSGVSTVTKNTGSLQNTGLEFSVNAYVSEGKFRWNTEVNIAKQNQKVLDLGLSTSIITGDIGGNFKMGSTQIIKVGEPLGSFFGYATNGIWQIADITALTTIPVQFGKNARAGDVRYVDQNADGIINDADRVILGNGIPDFFGGWNNKFSYKGFDASVFFQFSFGNSILNLNRVRLLNTNGNATENRLEEIMDHWTTENPSNTIPRIGFSEPLAVSDRLIEDGSYLRLREVTFGYTLPKPATTKLHIDLLRVYISATNLFTLTNYSGYNPEINSYGNSNSYFSTDLGGYPSYQTILVGLNITF